MQRSTKIILGSTIFIGGFFIVTNKKLKTRLTEAITSIKSFNTSQKNFKIQLASFNKALKKVNLVINETNQDLDRFKFNIEPHLEMIQKRLNNIKKN